MAKISPKQYAEAFVAALSERRVPQEKAVAHFLELIRKNGDWSRRAQIVAAVQKAVRAKEGKTLVVAQSARTLTDRQRKSIHDLFAHHHIELEEEINPELIAGVKLLVNDEEQFDGTLKHKLDSILGNI